MTYRCPECGSKNLEVVVEVWATLIQKDGQIKTAAPKEANHEWGAESVMRCTDCNHQAIADEFEAMVKEAV